jgi:hypothetical protein
VNERTSRSGHHFCGAPNKYGWCQELLPASIPRCRDHAIIVVRGNSRLYIPISDFRVGDKIVRAY